MLIARRHTFSSRALRSLFCHFPFILILISYQQWHTTYCTVGWKYWFFFRSLAPPALCKHLSLFVYIRIIRSIYHCVAFCTFWEAIQYPRADEENHMLHMFLWPTLNKPSVFLFCCRATTPAATSSARSRAENDKKRVNRITFCSSPSSTPCTR